MPRPEVPKEAILVGGREGWTLATAKALHWIRTVAARAPTAAIDLETRGTRPEDPNTAIVGLGLAARRQPNAPPEAIYLDWQSVPPRSREDILAAIYALPKNLIAHNMLFDGTLLFREHRHVLCLNPAPFATDEEADASAHAPFKACTFGLYHQLASEGWKGQSWGLKEAEVDLLGWPQSHEGDRDRWLVENGYITKGPKRRKAKAASAKKPERPEETREAWLARVVEKYDGPDGRKKVRPDLSQMWRVPASILGPYCALDCIATLEIHDRVLMPALARFPELARFHTEIFLENNRFLTEQVIDGLRVNVPGFEAYAKECEARVAELHANLRSDTRISLFISAWERKRFDEELGEEPEKFLPFRRKLPKKEHNKDGSVSKPWLAYHEALAEHDAAPPIRASWLAWEKRKETLLAPGKKGRGKWEFNFSSTDHLRALFYGEQSPIKWRETRREGMNGFPSIEIDVTFPDGRVLAVECDRTKKGALPTGKRAMMQWGDLGKTLLKYREEGKELSYVHEWLANVFVAPEGTRYAGTTRVHPGWIFPGTVTLRPVGKKPNVAQCPKSVRFMENILCDDGEVWLEDDMASVEPTVLCELTRDPALMALYGPGARPNCAYLYNGADLPVIGPAIRATGYDPLSPTAESVATAKKGAKGARTSAKVITLGKQYGMGASKMQSELRLQCGVFLSPEEAQDIDAAWKEKYKVSGREYSAKLKAEWKKNGGWFLDGLGHPVCVDEAYLKDAISRCVQRCAHSIHMIRVVLISRRLREHGLHIRWRVVNWYDQYIGAVPEDKAETALQCAKDSYTELNAWLQGLISIRGGPKLARNMAEAKEAEE